MGWEGFTTERDSLYGKEDITFESAITIRFKLPSSTKLYCEIEVKKKDITTEL